MCIIILFFLSVVSCPREAIITQIIKSLVTKLQNTVNLTVEHHTVIAGVVRNKTSKENWPIEALLRGDTLQSAWVIISQTLSCCDGQFCGSFFAITPLMIATILAQLKCDLSGTLHYNTLLLWSLFLPTKRTYRYIFYKKSLSLQPPH